MRVIKLEAGLWQTSLDFYDALLLCLEAPHWHGKSMNALVDSMVYGGINGVDPPYKIWVVGVAGLTADVKQEVDCMVQEVTAHQGNNQKIEFQIDP